MSTSTQLDTGNILVPAGVVRSPQRYLGIRASSHFCYPLHLMRQEKTTEHPGLDIAPSGRLPRTAAHALLQARSLAASGRGGRGDGGSSTEKCSSSRGGRRTRLDRPPRALDTVALKRRPTDAQADDAQRPDSRDIDSVALTVKTSLPDLLPPLSPSSRGCCRWGKLFPDLGTFRLHFAHPGLPTTSGAGTGCLLPTQLFLAALPHLFTGGENKPSTPITFAISFLPGDTARSNTGALFRKRRIKLVLSRNASGVNQQA